MTLAPMKTGTDFAAHWKMTPTNIMIAPTNKVTLRPNRSETKGVKGRACKSASVDQYREARGASSSSRIWRRYFGPSLSDLLINQIKINGNRRISDDDGPNDLPVGL